MGMDNRAVHEVDFPVQFTLGITLGLQLRQKALPDTDLPPAVETTRHRAPFTIPFGQVSPGSACPQYPKDSIDDLSMAKIRPPSSWFLRWQQRF
jgi:hypothetical protein